MPNARDLIKRGSPSAWPDELVVITNPRHKDYDERILVVPVTDERIRNFVAIGQIQPVSVVIVGDDLVVNAGRQRWKRATVINHIVGVRPYTGKLDPVLEAINRIKGTDFAKWIADVVPNGMKLQYALYRGDEMEAGRASVSENEQRDEDPRETKIRKAQRMAKHGHSEADIADAFGFGVDKAAVAKVKRMLKVDLSAPTPAPKTRAKPTRPSAKVISRIADALREVGHGGAELLDFTLGKRTAEEVAVLFPSLAEAFAAVAVASKVKGKRAA
jgi:hypothetical protein